MKDIITYINEWGGEKMRKPSMKDQLEILRKALNDNKDLDLAFEYDYFITDMIYASGNKELEIVVASDEHAGKHIDINTVKDFIEAENNAVMKCKKIVFVEKYDEFYLEDTFVHDGKLYLQIEQK
jgi:hypothetical protein